jgi:hypothetical protein
MQVSRRYGIVYLITKYGFIHLYECVPPGSASELSIIAA